jgi:phage terminase large subunit-like protein
VAAEIVDLPAFLVEVHRGGRRDRGGLAEIDEGLPPIGEVDGHKPAAADVAAARVNNGERIADRNRGIDRIPAILKHADPNLRGEAMRGHHHAVLRLDRGSGLYRRSPQHGC